MKMKNNNYDLSPRLIHIQELIDEINLINQTLVKLIKGVSPYIPYYSLNSDKLYFADLIYKTSICLKHGSELYNYISYSYENSFFTNTNSLKIKKPARALCNNNTPVERNTLQWVIRKSYNLLSNQIKLLKLRLCQVVHEYYISHLVLMLDEIDSIIRSLSKDIRKDDKIIKLSLDELGFSNILAPNRENIYNEGGRSNLEEFPEILRSVQSNLMCLEIPTIEVCCSILNEFEFQTCHAQFIVDLCKQIKDESRHAKMLTAILKENNIEKCITNIHHRFWNMSYGEDIDVRLAIHQKFGEWIGIDASIYRVIERKSKSDLRIASIYENIIIDEINHVKLGNKWSRAFSTDYEETIKCAILKRELCGESHNGQLKFRLNEQVCNLVDFREEEIHEFKRRQLEYGIMNDYHDLLIDINKNLC
jgi:hypothetical protein